MKWFLQLEGLQLAFDNIIVLRGVVENQKVRKFFMSHVFYLAEHHFLKSLLQVVDLGDVDSLLVGLNFHQV